MSNVRVLAIIEHPDKRLYVSQRAESKRRYRGLFGLGIEKAIEPGEARMESIQRRLRKVGITSEPNYLFEFVFNSDKRNATQVVYHIRSSNLVDPGREFQWKDWMNLVQIDELLTQGKLCPDTAIIYLRFKEEFYGKL